MQHIATLAKKAAQSAAPACKPKPSDERANLIAQRSMAWTNALMARLGSIYGAKWQDHVTACGGLDAVTAEWQQGIDGMSGEDIKRAIEHCRNNLAWPPSIAEFRSAAHGGSTAEQRAMAARLREADSAQRALPSETWAEIKARGASRLAEIRNTLRHINA